MDANDVLLWAARSCATNDTDESLPAGVTADDWAGVLRGAKWHRLEGALDQALARSGPADHVPEWVRAAVRADRQSAAVRTLRLQAELPVLIETLHAARTRVLLLKGGALTLCDLEYGYSTRGVRAMKDLDVLVERSRVGEAASALRALGYAAAPYPDDSDEARAQHHEHALVSPDGSVVIELHHHIAPDTDAFDIAPWWQRAVPVTAYGCEVLAPEDQLTHLCLHFSFDRAHRTSGALMQTVDITRTLTFASDLDWDAFERRVFDEDLRAPVAFALHSATLLLGARVPDGLLDRLTPSSLAAVPLPALVDRRVLREQGLSTLHARNYAKPAGIVRRLFPSAEDLRHRYNTAENGRGLATVRAYARHYAYALEVSTRPLRHPRDAMDELQAERALDGFGRRGGPTTGTAASG